MALGEVAQISGVELPEGPYATLGGYVMAELGRLPRTGDVVEHDGLRLTVVYVERTSLILRLISESIPP